MAKIYKFVLLLRQQTINRTKCGIKSFLYYAFSVQFAESIHKLSLCLSVRMYAIVVLRSKHT